MDVFTIDPKARIGQVHLKVSDIDKSLKFYESFLGLKIIEKTSQIVFLSSDGKMLYLIALSKAKSSNTNQQRRVGRYHFAILLPQRKDLGDFLSNLLKHKDEIKSMVLRTILCQRQLHSRP
ncbi:MAG: VOC family protein [Nitrosarchaeum sp.]